MVPAKLCHDTQLSVSGFQTGNGRYLRLDVHVATTVGKSPSASVFSSSVDIRWMCGHKFRYSRSAIIDCILSRGATVLCPTASWETRRFFFTTWKWFPWDWFADSSYAVCRSGRHVPGFHRRQVQSNVELCWCLHSRQHEQLSFADGCKSVECFLQLLHATNFDSLHCAIFTSPVQRRVVA
jgi:hypothetical protein